MNQTKFYNQKHHFSEKWRKLGSKVAKVFTLWTAHLDAEGDVSFTRIAPGTEVVFTRGRYQVQLNGSLVRLDKPQSRVKRLRNEQLLAV